MEESEKEQIRREMEQARGGNRAQTQETQAQGPSYFAQNSASNIHQIIGIVSGKGGVGKSLVTGILAIELARAGKRVAILDADITGPSIPKMFGLSGEHLVAQNNLMIPAQTDGGIKIVSTNLLLEHESDPVLWRGPILMGVIKQFYEEAAWGEIDCMLVDMPPGTGDVALTVFQSLPIDGVIVVSTPQSLVQMVVGKAVNMAQMMEVPIIGLVENMSYVTCGHCGERLEAFGPSRAEETASAYGMAVLGCLPLDPAITSSCDAGTIERDLPDGLLDVGSFGDASV